MDDKNLRVKFSQGDVVIELEGDSSTVLSELRSIKKEGVGKLVEFFGQVPTLRSPIQTAIPAPKDSQPPRTVHKDIKGFSPLKDIVLKGLPKSEAEWITVYGYFASNGGKKEFTRDELSEQYKDSRRATKSRGHNLTNSIKQATIKGWLSSISQDTFSLLPDGVQKAQEIAAREKPPKRRLVRARTKKEKAEAKK